MHNKSLELRRENAGAFPASQLQRYENLMKELIYYLGTIISVSSLAYHFISRFWFASEEIKEALADNTKRMDKYNEKYWRHTAISLIGCVLGCILIILGI